MLISEIVLVAAPDPDFRRSLEFALESAGFRANGHALATDALVSEMASEAVCAVIEDDAIDDWRLAPEQFYVFARPVILVVGRLRAMPVLPRVTFVMKPFLGEPLIQAVRNAVSSSA